MDRKPQIVGTPRGESALGNGNRRDERFVESELTGDSQPEFIFAHGFAADGVVQPVKIFLQRGEKDIGEIKVRYVKFKI